MTDAFLETEAVLHNLDVPLIEMVGEKRKKVVIKSPKAPLISTCHMYDSDGNELVRDQVKLFVCMGYQMTLSIFMKIRFVYNSVVNVSLDCRTATCVTLCS